MLFYFVYLNFMHCCFLWSFYNKEQSQLKTVMTKDFIILLLYYSQWYVKCSNQKTSWKPGVMPLSTYLLKKIYIFFSHLNMDVGPQTINAINSIEEFSVFQRLRQLDWNSLPCFFSPLNTGCNEKPPEFMQVHSHVYTNSWSLELWQLFHY